jgi:hypothetical protein
MMEVRKSGPKPEVLAVYQGYADRGLTTAETAAAMGVLRSTVRAYAKDHGLAFVDYNPCRTSATPMPPASQRDVLTVFKKSRNELGHLAKPVPISLPRPPFEIDMEIAR